MATKKTLENQIMRKLNSGDPPAGSSFHPLEIQEAIKQQINLLLKTEHFNVTLPSGETIPDGCVLATYEDIAVTQWNDVSKSTLPAIPLKLPRNMGVFHIGKPEDAFSGFIPMKMGVFSQLNQQRLINDLTGLIGYELRGKEVVYTKDLTTETPAINTVTMRLIVSDFSLYTDYELLPIDADMEAQIIEAVYNQFAPQPLKPEIASSVSEQG
jgi:hypothetical protein